MYYFPFKSFHDAKITLISQLACLYFVFFNNFATNCSDRSKYGA